MYYATHLYESQDQASDNFFNSWICVMSVTNPNMVMLPMATIALVTVSQSEQSVYS